jgi:DNA invertase Pin-like site-specific DNA recombinase
MNNPSNPRVAIYARSSSDSNPEASIEAQVRACRDHVRRNGGVVDESLVFTDVGVGGAGTSRHGLQSVMGLADGKPAPVDVVVTQDLSRIARDVADLAHVRERLEQGGVALRAVNDGDNDTSSPGHGCADEAPSTSSIATEKRK